MSTIDFEYIDCTLDELAARGITPIYLNSSSLKLASCARRYAMTVAGELVSNAPTDSILTMGSALHKFAEFFTRTSGDTTDALTEARRCYPSINAGELIPLVSRRSDVRIPAPLILDGQMCVEVKFAIPWLVFTYDGVTYCFVICGTIDHLGLEASQLAVIDYKSTRYAVIDYAVKKYAHETQFKFYLWALWKFGARFLPLEIHNLLRTEQAYSQVCFIQLTGKSPRWIMDPTKRFMTSYMYEEYERALREKITDLARWYIKYRVEGPLNTPAHGMTTNNCQYCTFTSYCHARSFAEQAAFINTLDARPYNPIEERGEVI